MPWFITEADAAARDLAVYDQFAAETRLHRGLPDLEFVRRMKRAGFTGGWLG